MEFAPELVNNELNKQFFAIMSEKPSGVYLLTGIQTISTRSPYVLQHVDSYEQLLTTSITHRLLIFQIKRARSPGHFPGNNRFLAPISTAPPLTRTQLADAVCRQ
jgi:hypothetical protein